MSKKLCEICHQPMPEGEEVFRYHGYSGDCPVAPPDEQLVKDEDEEIDHIVDQYSKDPARLIDTMTAIPTNDTDEYKLIIFGWITTVLGIPKDADPTKYNELTDRLMELFAQHSHKAVEEAYRDGCLDTRGQIALDNYRGHTFSDSTDWKGKYEKFMRNNERVIELLELKKAKKGEQS